MNHMKNEGHKPVLDWTIFLNPKTHFMKSLWDLQAKEEFPDSRVSQGTNPPGYNCEAWLWRITPLKEDSVLEEDPSSLYMSAS